MATPEKKPEQGSLGDKLSKGWENLQKQELFNFAKGHTRDTICFVALFVGLFTILFSHFWGGLILGAVAGFYFSTEIVSWIKEFQKIMDQAGMVKALVIIAIALGFFIALPAFFIGCLLAVGVKFIASSIA